MLFQVALIPDAHFNMKNTGPGCFTHLGGQFIRVGAGTLPRRWGCCCPPATASPPACCTTASLPRRTHYPLR